ncbi:MAG: Rieske 2Fe-2S domain-containing protein [Anaerolineae bacterium]|nr:Rieske 2Fe-2S domain-containing protein [Thermoflexales bacterium]MDW8406937.1 Rieske 2Fe-2S domain-containing protein [Anaerolineae bacterium]
MSEFVFAAKAEDVKEGEILTVQVNEVSIGLTRLNGVARAFRDVCTHDDGPLGEGVIEGEEIVCPRHGARFHLRTGKATFPAPAPLPFYDVIEENGAVKVRLES